MKSYRILYLLILLIFVSCSENKEARELFAKVESVMEEHPDSALAMLDSAHIDRARLSDDIEGKYALLYTMAQDKSGLDVDDDSLIRIAYNYYKDKTEDSLYAKSQYYMGCYYALNDSTKNAELCFYHAIDRGKVSKDYRTAYLACYLLSRSLALSNTDKAIRIANEGLDIQKKHDSDNTLNHIYMLINIGNAYLYKDKTLCIPYFQKAEKLALIQNDSSVTGSTYRSLSTAYVSLGMRDSAMHYIEKAVKYSSDISLKLLYAAFLYDADSIGKSKMIFNQIAKSATSPDVLYTCYKYLSKISSTDLNDVNTSLNIDSAYTNIEKMYENSMSLRNDYYESILQKEKENTTLIRKAKEKDAYVIISISVGLLFVSIITLFYIYKKNEAKRKMLFEHQRYQLEIRLKEEEKRHQRELDEQKHKLEMEAAEMRFRDEITTRELQLDLMRNHFLSKLAFMKKIAKTKNDNKAINLTNEDWKEIETFLNGVDNLFVERIKKEYPNLKEKDLQFCMLLRLKCSTQDLMNIYCINEQSVKQKKYKFKAKLGISDTQISAKQFIVEY